MLNVTHRQLTENLITEWLEKLKYLDNIKREQLFKIGCSYCDAQINLLYEINRAVLEKKIICKDKSNNLTYINIKDKHLLVYKDNKMEFTHAQIKEIIVGLIDILEEVYPLGTTLELKKEFLKNISLKKEVKNVQVVIINRFIASNDAKSFFHYSGVLYPLGLVGDKSIIHFTHALVDKVLSKGHSDENENAYLYLMKKELIINKKMHSFGFSTEEETQSFKKKLG